MFTVISVFELLQTITLFYLSRYALPSAYYWGFWNFAAVDFFLQILLLMEIANVSLRPKGKLLAVPILPLVSFVVAGVALAAAVSVAASPPLADAWDLWEMRTSLFTSLLMCELCVALSAYANRLGLQWKTHVLAITQGYTAWAMISVIGDAAFAATGWHRNFAIFDQIRMIVYIGVLVYWSWALFCAEQRKPAPDLELIVRISRTYP